MKKYICNPSKAHCCKKWNCFLRRRFLLPLACLTTERMDWAMEGEDGEPLEAFSNENTQFWKGFAIGLACAVFAILATQLLGQLR